MQKAPPLPAAPQDTRQHSAAHGDRDGDTDDDMVVLPVTAAVTDGVAVTSADTDGDRLLLGVLHTQTTSGSTPEHSHSPAHPVCVTVAVGDALAVRDGLAVGEPLPEPLRDKLDDREPLREPLVVPLPARDADAEPLGVALSLGELDGVPLSVGEGDSVAVSLAVSLADEVTVALPLTDADRDALRVRVGVAVGGVTHASSVTAPSSPDDADAPATEKLSQEMPRETFTQLLPPPPPLG